MMLWYGSEMSGWAYAGMAIGMVLFWTALIVGGVVLLQQVFGTNNATY
ncbi:membrane protein [Mycobacteroides abscessus subsp. abscessus]|nr:membrane protein [Mycobacteroides abscessus subsp. abscessus]